MSMQPAGAIDLGTQVDRFLDASERFFHFFSRLEWEYFAAALVLSLALQLCRAHGWSNAVRAAYPASRFRESRLAAAFLIGSGANAVLPARAGDAIKIVLAKRSVPESSYPAVISSFAVLAPFDTAIGVLVLGYAITQGLLPELPRLPDLPAFEISFWADHPIALALTVAGIVAAVTALLVWSARRARSIWAELAQGVTILRRPRRYLREVAAWQLLGWLCRFASFWLFLEAFHLEGSVQNVLLVMSVQAVAGALPFTPGGAGATQALLVATLEGPSRTAVLAYSAGQQIAVAAWSVAIAAICMVLVFRTGDWRKLIREGEDAMRERTRPESASP
jgi:uncharacterized membrane protein YbhN (UPF0104 family)